MDGLTWQEHILPTADLDIAWYEVGNGPTVVFLNGGPGDSHRYLRPVVAPLADRFHCVLYDQRGCGRSRLDHPDESALRVHRFVDDLEALRRCLGQERLALVGHSWGATLALVYAIAHPDHVERVALLSMGPIDDEMDTVAEANILKPLSAVERDELATLRAELPRAARAGDEERVRVLREREASLSMRAWFASPAALEGFLVAYRTEDPTNRRVNRLAWASYRDVRAGLAYERVTAPVLILYGYQDFEPITQAFALRERLPRARVRFLNQCGHEPWLEQPQQFYRELWAFLDDAPAPTSALQS